MTEDLHHFAVAYVHLDAGAVQQVPGGAAGHSPEASEQQRQRCNRLATVESELANMQSLLTVVWQLRLVSSAAQQRRRHNHLADGLDISACMHAAHAVMRTKITGKAQRV